ncbi:MAG: NUDIX hydrolase [Candidatus Bipolaricaulota bacterium]|nr:NUDIX hydrolase [Candidatus Bipolaricaulota bacterium]MCX7844242.1 NUDIX hydrolase [Candidatus Bipolaricaulota bacterium]MDW8151861.1 NUDIX hydrolase [Candidatus Bipolaricaulota bacterium]
MCAPAAAADRTSEVLFSGRLLRVLRRWGPHGPREVVEHPGAVAIVVTDEEGRVLLVRQRREGPGRDLWEIPAGTLEPGEKPYACARRELQEEVGLSGKLRFLGVVFPTPGYSTERIFLFRLVEGGGAPRAQHEIAEARFFSAEEILNMARRGEGDGKTLAALAFLWAARAGFPPPSGRRG